MKILVTGAAGFIGAALSLHLLERGDDVVGMDNLNDYYDIHLKKARLARLTPHKNFTFLECDIANNEAIAPLFAKEKFQCVVHLAAQAGVRYSITNPHVYAQSNLVGFLTILEGCRQQNVEHLVYASSSSVYGANTKLPFSTSDNVDHPVSLYAATKKANELMAHSYSHLYGLSTTGLRFFTVYGEWGRPDMSPFIFTRQILANKPIDLFNYGNHQRDFTYIDDIVEGITRVIDNPPIGNKDWNGEHPDPATSPAPYRLFNIGNSSPIKLMEYIGAIEEAVGKIAIKNFLPMQLGDVPMTHADVTHLEKAVGYKPATPVKEGIRRFVEWYKGYYK